MDLRASPSAAERGTWARPLRSAVLARPSPPCTHDDARLRFPATQSPQKSEMGKKESTDRRLNQACRPSVTPSSLSSLECRRSDARTATNGYVRTCSLNKSAKVVLVTLSASLRSRLNDPFARGSGLGSDGLKGRGLLRVPAKACSLAAPGKAQPVDHDSLLNALRKPSRRR